MNWDGESTFSYPISRKPFLPLKYSETTNIAQATWWPFFKISKTAFKSKKYKKQKF
jgi:hypothetical protein